MSLLPASSIGDESTGFYNGVVEQSLRLDGSAAYLMKTYGANASSTNKFALSMWVKIADVTATGDRMLASSFDGTTVMFYLQYVGASKTFRIYIDPSSSGSNELIRNATGQVFRDPSNWYHIALIVDMTLSGNENKAKLYVNGNLLSTVDSSSTGTPTTQNIIKNGTTFYFSRYFTAAQYFSGYYADVHLIDGAANYTDFAESKNGAWIPKAYSGSYGNNGVRLQFKETGDGQTSPSSSTIGADTSGNSNHFKDVSLDAHDSNILDCPENNYNVQNPLQINTSYTTLSEGGLKVTGATSANSGVSLGTFSVTSGKWYFEVRQGTIGSEFIGVMVKQVSYENSLIDGSSVAQTHGKGVVARYNGAVRGISGELQLTSTTAWTTGDIIGIAFDMDNGAVYFAKNNTYLNSGNPASGSSKTGSFLNFTVDSTRIATPALDAYNGGNVTANFGQDGTFLGTETAQGNTDDNGQGNFYYAPPSGYLALCSANLPDVTIGPDSTSQADDYFNTVPYTGNATDDTSITGVGFQPDWLWIKERSSTSDHVLLDSSRGASKFLVSHSTQAENTATTIHKSFDSDGFTLGTSGATNENSQTYVSWNWKANGGTTSSNTDGSITSTVQANTDAGFSIVTYTANNNTKGTVGHGLNSAPNMVIIKNRDSSPNGQWVIGQDLSGFTGQVYFDTGAFSTNSGSFDNTAPTSTVVTINTDNTVNEGTDKFVMYCFHSVEGYSKIGEYTGNGSTDGTFVYTGFRPAFVMTKKTSGSGNWYINDTGRYTFNPTGGHLYADLNNAESGTGIDILSNGFKPRNTDSSQNASGGTYIYMAFAEQPFKFSNAR